MTDPLPYIHAGDPDQCPACHRERTAQRRRNATRGLRDLTTYALAAVEPENTTAGATNHNEDN